MTLSPSVPVTGGALQPLEVIVVEVSIRRISDEACNINASFLHRDIQVD